MVVRAGEAEHVRGDLPLRIGSQLLRVEPDPRQIALREGVGLDGVGLPGDVDEPLRAILQDRVELVRIEAERLADDDGRTLGVDDVAGVRVDRGRLLADREWLSGAVVDRSAAGRDLDRLAVLRRRHRRVAVVLRGLHVGGAGDGDEEEESEREEKQANAVIRAPLSHFAPSRT